MGTVCAPPQCLGAANGTLTFSPRLFSLSRLAGGLRLLSIIVAACCCKSPYIAGTVRGQTPLQSPRSRPQSKVSVLPMSL